MRDDAHDADGYGTVVCADALDVYGGWDAPDAIVSDGAYGLRGFEGDPGDVSELPDWYLPHIEAWSEAAHDGTTLWFWNTERGWAAITPLLEARGWEFRGLNIWDKTRQHISGRSNTQNIRRFPVVTEVCAQYVRAGEASLELPEGAEAMRDWFRDEWLRTGLSFDAANAACDVADAATRRYFASGNQWTSPPPERLEALIAYANAHGDPDGAPYFEFESAPCSREEFLEIGEPRVAHETTFDCPAGVTNVWREPPVHQTDRVRSEGDATHPNQKPLSLMRRIIRASTSEGDLVWEPFGGMCSASVAAKQLARQSVAAERNTEYVKAARHRLRRTAGNDGRGQQTIRAFADGEAD